MPLDRLARAGVENGERGGSEERAQQSAAAPHAKARSCQSAVGSWQPMPRRFDSLVFLAVTARAPQIEWAIPTLPWQSNAPAPPVSETAKALASETLSQALADNTVVIFSASSKCEKSSKVKELFEDEGIPYYALEFDNRGDGEALRLALAEKCECKHPTPSVYIRGQLISGWDLNRASKTGELVHWTHAPDPSDAETEV